MKRFLLFLFGALICFSANAQTTNPLEIEGAQPEVTTTGHKVYFVKNVGTGLYLCNGGRWGTNTIESHAANPFCIEENGDYVALAGLTGFVNSKSIDGLWVDQSKEFSNWKIEKVNENNQYRILNSDGKALASLGNPSGLLEFQESVDKPLQYWVFLTEEDMRAEYMSAASVGYPVDVTPFIKASSFDYTDATYPGTYTPGYFKESSNVLGKEMPYARAWGNYLELNGQADGNLDYSPVWGYGSRDWDVNVYNWLGAFTLDCPQLDGGKKSDTIMTEVVQKVTLPKGSYSFSFHALYLLKKYVLKENQSKSFIENEYTTNSSTEETSLVSDGSATVSVCDKSFSIDAGSETLDVFDGFASIALKFLNEETYMKQGSFYLSEAQEVEFKISVTAPRDYRDAPSGSGFPTQTRTVTTDNYTARMFFDDFRLYYFGEDELASSEMDKSLIYSNQIEAVVEEYKKNFNDVGDAVLDEYLKGLGEIGTDKEYYNAIASMEAAYLVAKSRHNAEEWADVTGAIINPSFETGDLTGWTVGWYSAQTDVRTSETAGVDGKYHFNSWWNGVPVYQTVTGLANGRYKLEVLIASGDAGNDATVYLFANDEKLGVNPPSEGASFGDYSLEFEVVDGTARIGTVGGNDDDTAENPIGSYNENGYWWYKCDNFRLTYLGNEIYLSEESTTCDYVNNEFYTSVTIDRAVPSGNWSTLVVPFNMPIPEGWSVKELTADTYINGSCLCLRFADVDIIKAGVPYLVRHTQGESVTLPEVKDVALTTTLLPSCVSGCVDFCGTYTTGVIPAGAYYLSGNKFYKATTDIPTKGFRAYFMPKSAEIKSLGFDFDDVDFTGIEGVESNAAETVAIYGADGTLRSDLQKGINIVRMSDGTTKKVMVK